MKKRDLYSSLFFLGVGVLFVVGSLRFSVWDRYGPGPGFFPLVLGIMFSILSLLLFISKIVDKGREGGIAEEDSLRFPAIKKTVLYLCLLLCFGFLFEHLGFLLTILFFMTGVLVSFSRRSIKLSLIISILTSVTTYLLFVKLLDVPLPGGILENLIRF
jgi:putative tricarboxylic transport membrane protein